MTAALRTSRAAGGFSLVELLVAVAINLVVIIVAANLYLGTRETQRAMTEKATMFENGSFALDVIGRELENAGFYPAISAESAAKSLVVNTYENPVAGSPDAYDAGLFGCDDKLFQATDATCAAHSASPAPDADSLVVSYFTNDSLSLDSGQRADCQRRAVDNDPTNAARKGPSTSPTGVAPLVPLFVSNRYTLVPTTLDIEGQSVSTFSLACNGNGVNPQDNTYQPIVAGIEQLRFRYGSYSNPATLQPDQFYAAADVPSGSITVGPTERAGWARIGAVRACLVVRSMQRARLVTGASYTLVDCDGVSQTYSDGIERRVFSQVFAVKNHLPQTYPME